MSFSFHSPVKTLSFSVSMFHHLLSWLPVQVNHCTNSLMYSPLQNLWPPTLLPYINFHYHALGLSDHISRCFQYLICSRQSLFMFSVYLHNCILTYFLPFSCCLVTYIFSLTSFHPLPVLCIRRSVIYCNWVTNQSYISTQNKASACFRILT